MSSFELRQTTAELICSELDVKGRELFRWLIADMRGETSIVGDSSAEVLNDALCEIGGDLYAENEALIAEVARLNAELDAMSQRCVMGEDEGFSWALTERCEELTAELRKERESPSHNGVVEFLDGSVRREAPVPERLAPSGETVEQRVIRLYEGNPRRGSVRATELGTITGQSTARVREILLAAGYSEVAYKYGKSAAPIPEVLRVNGKGAHASEQELESVRSAVAVLEEEMAPVSLDLRKAILRKAGRSEVPELIAASLGLTLTQVQRVYARSGDWIERLLGASPSTVKAILVRYEQENP